MEKNHATEKEKTERGSAILSFKEAYDSIGGDVDPRFAQSTTIRTNIAWLLLKREQTSLEGLLRFLHHEEGLSLKAIAALFGCGKAKVVRLYKKYGVERRNWTEANALRFKKKGRKQPWD